MNTKKIDFLKKVLPSLHPTPIDEKRFLLMANASPSMIWITDEQGTPIFVNKTWIDLTGLTVDEALTYRGWISCVHPDDKKEVFKLYYRIHYSYEHISAEYRLKRADGCWRWILDHGVPFYNEEGDFAGYIGSAVDITERKQVEAELRVAAAAFESTEGMFITDANTVILRVNRNFTEITGYSANEVVGHKPNLLKSGCHDEAFYEAMWQSILEKGSWQGEIWDKRKNGEIYPKLLTITAVKDKKGIVVNYVGTQIDITAQKSAQSEIERLAFYDTLTNLPNRRLLLERLEQNLLIAKRNKTWGSVMFIDMDNFKNLNDTLGHDYGDELLIQVASRLKQCVRESDTVARLGGDEFVVMLTISDTNLSEHVHHVEMIANHILNALNKTYRLKNHEYHSTPSIGISLFGGTEFLPADEVLKQADIAMYQAKASGRNTLRFFNGAMQEKVTSRFTLEKALHDALLNNEFEVYYQPQITTNGKVIGAEALIRWIDSQKKVISPLDFIPLAEETGLIIPIGDFVLETVCQQIKSWSHDLNKKNLQIAVNVSVRQFKQENFAEKIENLLDKYEINSECLKLELTESILLENPVEITQKIKKLQCRGIKFSMDDFGTGYSSLSYLTRLPLNQLKIDQSFIRCISQNNSNAVLVKTIIEMAKNLNIEVIAEGVETQEQYNFLEENGCSFHQGYLFSKPLSLEQFENYLNNYINPRN